MFDLRIIYMYNLIWIIKLSFVSGFISVKLIATLMKIGGAKYA